MEPPFDMIKIYRVANGEGLNPEQETEKAKDFHPHVIHIRNDDGEYIVVVMYPETHEDYTQIDELDPAYHEIYNWVNQDGFLDEMFDPEVYGTIQ